MRLLYVILFVGGFHIVASAHKQWHKFVDVAHKRNWPTAEKLLLKYSDALYMMLEFSN